MSTVAYYVFGAIFVIGLLISYSPIGEWVFKSFFGVQNSLIKPTVDVYRVLMFVSFFSALRCLYHGIIISNYRTKWLTIGMAVRLVVMYLISIYFIRTGQLNSGTVGAVIFLAGMAVESMVAFIEGRKLLGNLPAVKENHTVTTQKHIMTFYKPLLYSSGIAVFLGPSVNALLGQTVDVELTIASFAIASSVFSLLSSFFSYIHQIVLNFYNKDSRIVQKFVLLLGFIPSALISCITFTPAGEWLLQDVMGVKGQLLEESLSALKVFILFAAVFPWLDYLNGLMMLKGQTHITVRSQTANLAMTFIVMVSLVFIVPQWGGQIGALAVSLGAAAEAAVVYYVLMRMYR
jgi:Na+-driven multidrug efflux pump